MEEMKGTAYAINALGNTIAELTQELYYERMRTENAENRIKQMQAENDRLTKKLNAVDAFIEREVG
jgi:hypothetical protein